MWQRQHLRHQSPSTRTSRGQLPVWATRRWNGGCLARMRWNNWCAKRQSSGSRWHLTSIGAGITSEQLSCERKLTSCSGTCRHDGARAELDRRLSYCPRAAVHGSAPDDTDGARAMTIPERVRIVIAAGAPNGFDHVSAGVRCHVRG